MSNLTVKLRLSVRTIAQYYNEHQFIDDQWHVRQKCSDHIQGSLSPHLSNPLLLPFINATDKVARPPGYCKMRTGTTHVYIPYMTKDQEAVYGQSWDEKEERNPTKNIPWNITAIVVVPRKAYTTCNIG